MTARRIRTIVSIAWFCRAADASAVAEVLQDFRPARSKRHPSKSGADR
jgi:hypothetical protein